MIQLKQSTISILGIEIRERKVVSSYIDTTKILGISDLGVSEETYCVDRHGTTAYLHLDGIWYAIKPPGEEWRWRSCARYA